MNDAFEIVELRDGWAVRVPDSRRNSTWILAAFAGLAAWLVLHETHRNTGFGIVAFLVAVYATLWALGGTFHLAFWPGKVVRGWSAFGIGWSRGFDAARVRDFRVVPGYDPDVLKPGLRKGAIEFDVVQACGGVRTVDCLASLTPAQAQQVVQEIEMRRAFARGATVQ